ncbi:MAG TPA: hypothetical protein VF246_06020 [Acidimicrobiia bacterium]
MMVVSHRIEPDPSRLIARPLIPGNKGPVVADHRLDNLVDRVLGMPGDVRRSTLDELRQRHEQQYGELDEIWARHLEIARGMTDHIPPDLGDEESALLGAYLTQGYAYEAAALTNPSIVAHGPETNGRQGFVMSARAIGEGHISSIAFITGTVDTSGQVTLDDRSQFASNGRRTTPGLSRRALHGKLQELGYLDRASERIVNLLPETYHPDDIDEACRKVRDSDIDDVEVDLAVARVHWVSSSNYDVAFDPDKPISEHLISPSAPVESQGMEDARFVRFADDDGSVIYYGTYTAFDGTRILPQLIETKDFHSFRISTMVGPAAHHKGISIFPRRINGDLMAISRHDHVNCYVLRSDDIRDWTNAELAFGPEYEWELVHMGNCGSPIELPEGWLVITHGVGPMRRYSLGAVLLDLDEPSKVIGRLREPLIEPTEGDEFGYVPNVVYSCGSMTYADLLVVPYGFADRGIRFAVTPLAEVLSAMS